MATRSMASPHTPHPQLACVGRNTNIKRGRYPSAALHTARRRSSSACCCSARSCCCFWNAACADACNVIPCLSTPYIYHVRKLQFRQQACVLTTLCHRMSPIGSAYTYLLANQFCLFLLHSCLSSHTVKPSCHGKETTWERTCDDMIVNHTIVWG